MEFPELGTHCSFSECSRLDFLPIECDACHLNFCKEHSPYEKHNCTLSYTKDARVPVCPLCNQPVPINKGEDPNIKVNVHIQNECKSELAKTNSNRCSVPGCRKKELVPVKCNTCQKNFCLKHRFETDHNCEGHPHRLGNRPAPNRGQSTTSTTRSAGSNMSGGRSKTTGGGTRSGNPQKTALSQIGADLNRERQQRQQQSRGQSSSQHAPLQPNMVEDEALARAMAASLGQSTPHSSSTSTSTSSPSPLAHHSPHPSQPQSNTAAATTIDEDEALARAIAASLNDDDQPTPKPKSNSTSQGVRRHRDKSADNDTCSIS